MATNRESMGSDVVIIGAGPSGLSTAIKLAQLAKANNTELSICILEKGAEVGAHILSGAVLEPRALDELIPDWQQQQAPIDTAAKTDKFLFLTKNKAIRLPTPSPMKNHGNYIISLSKLCRWLANIAENLGVQIFPGFAATEILYNSDNKVIGVATSDVGIDKNGQKKPGFQPGIELHATYTVFAEGCRGSLTKQVINKFNLDENSSPQTYGLGIKEVWEIAPEKHSSGEIIHTIGWPLDYKTYGGSFIYHMQPNLLSIGFVIGLDYENPYLSPYQEFQRFKHHPAIAPLLTNGKRISYGAKALNEGGLQSIPKVFFPGGVLVGCSAGFLNVAKIKGNHTAMKSGMLAAEAIFDGLTNKEANKPANLTEYNIKLKQSWIWQELKQVRNIRPGFQYGLYIGLANAAIDNYIFCGKAPWTLKLNQPDHKHIQSTAVAKPINYPEPDNKISFDRLTSVRLSGTFHEEDQPCHLQLKNPELAIKINWQKYSSPEQRFCPAGVYEIIELQDKAPYLQINAQNCLHCKACDIKDPEQNINWVPPEGGGGPRYSDM